jgi:hypothetical protein
MDGKSFDRLSVVVHRLREQATRRGALRLLLGGSLAVAGTLAADEGEARRRKNRKRKQCRGYGAACGGNRDCCAGKCRNGRCWFTGGGGGGGGGGRRCGSTTCVSGYRCCQVAGTRRCAPKDHPICCGNNGFSDGYACCGSGSGACGFGRDCCPGLATACCQEGWKCCGNGRCCPKGWYCDTNNGVQVCSANQNAGLSAAAQTMPAVEATPVDDDDWVEIAPGEGEA